MLNDYVRSDLKYENDLPYEILTNRVRPWSYAPYQNQYVNVAETLRGAMVQNPALKVLVAAGYYDFATPYFAAQYTIDHMGLDPALAKNIPPRALRRRPHDVHPEGVAREADADRGRLLRDAPESRRRRQARAIRSASRSRRPRRRRCRPRAPSARRSGRAAGR